MNRWRRNWVSTNVSVIHAPLEDCADSCDMTRYVLKAVHQHNYNRKRLAKPNCGNLLGQTRTDKELIGTMQICSMWPEFLLNVWWTFLLLKIGDWKTVPYNRKFFISGFFISRLYCNTHQEFPWLEPRHLDCHPGKRNLRCWTRSLPLLDLLQGKRRNKFKCWNK